MLSPRRLLDAIAPALALDDEVAGGWRLVDCHRLGDDDPIRLEVERDGVRFEVDLEPTLGREGAGPEPFRAVAGLGFGYRPPASHEDGVAVCDALEQVLRQTLGEADRQWALLPPAAEELPAAIQAEVVLEPTSLVDDPDYALLLRDFDGYERLFGRRPRALRVRVAGRAPRGLSLHYPEPREGLGTKAPELDAVSRRVAHRRRMRRYFAGLGYAFDAEAIPRTVPTPTTYARALADRPEVAPIRPRLLGGVSASLRPIHWGIFVRRNLLPVTIAPSWSVGVHDRIRHVGPLRDIPLDVGMPVHDLGLHALAIHAFPRQVWTELVERAVERVRARPWRMLAGPYGVLARLAGFFEGSVTAAGWEAWRTADEPEAFATSLEPQLPALFDELAEL